ncbi:Alpha/Beta hydrolase protein [Paraphoma chrysanthemicola]|uniref:Alpha/Beta hydrolase protein n=1 Tax=Paraphoma chrysanthemicola TaxID=798071 RepID=A0A8K0W4T8_9PLEO|nr:Alpha/Beta hydrolase protein [Paraphoma chrysanthemicola]
MKLTTIAVFNLAGAIHALPYEPRQSGSGDGSYGPGTYKTDSTLPSHTIYLPSKPGNTTLPVFIWGNGGCSADGTSNIQLLQQIASYGYLAIASGGPKQSGSTTAKTMTDSIDWVVSNAGKGAYTNVDSKKIMVAGFSCGGIEAYAQSWDSRVASVGIFSSGLLTNYSAAGTFTKPILYVLGGTSDIAYANGERDFKALPANTPAWKGNLNVGHGGTLNDANGGKFGKAGLNWLEWIFRNDAQAKAYFTSGYTTDGWQVETRALDKLKPLV